MLSKSDAHVEDINVESVAVKDNANVVDRIFAVVFLLFQCVSRWWQSVKGNRVAQRGQTKGDQFAFIRTKGILKTHSFETIYVCKP